MRRLAAALVAILVLLPAGVAVARCPKTSEADVEDEVMCVACQVPLDVATESPQADRERAFVRAQVARCRSKAQIKRALVAQLGPEVLASPPHHGFGAAAYLVPLLALVLGGATVAGALARRRGASEGGPAPPAALSGADAARLARDLERSRG
jgi:cytochrome c-type biogenesis protein CcmH